MSRSAEFSCREQSSIERKVNGLANRFFDRSARLFVLRLRAPSDFHAFSLVMLSVALSRLARLRLSHRLLLALSLSLYFSKKISRLRFSLSLFL